MLVWNILKVIHKTSKEFIYHLQTKIWNVLVQCSFLFSTLWHKDFIIKKRTYNTVVIILTQSSTNTIFKKFWAFKASHPGAWNKIKIFPNMMLVFISALVAVASADVHAPTNLPYPWVLLQGHQHLWERDLYLCVWKGGGYCSSHHHTGYLWSEAWNYEGDCLWSCLIWIWPERTLSMPWGIPDLGLQGPPYHCPCSPACSPTLPQRRSVLQRPSRSPRLSARTRLKISASMLPSLLMLPTLLTRRRSSLVNQAVSRSPSPSLHNYAARPMLLSIIVKI